MKVVGVTPYSQSKPLISEGRIKTGQKPNDFLREHWRECMHVNGDGFVFIPAMSVKNSLTDVAKFLGEPVPGKGKATYTKHFEAGTIVLDDVVLNVKADDVQPEDLFLPSDGVRGSGKRVWKRYPRIDNWHGIVRVIVTDPILEAKPDKVREYMVHIGKFIGWGRWRPRNGGSYGRFTVESFRVLKAEGIAA